MNYLVILPNQLFDKKYLLKNYKIIIYEHPHYFNSFKYNKKKLILHYSSMKYYYDYLKKNNFNVNYLDQYEKFNIKKYKIFDPIDKIKLEGDYEIIENPNFLLNNELIKKYREKTDKYFFNNFYNWSKKELNIIPNIKSKDKLNRKRLSKNILIPELPKIILEDDNKYINDAKLMVEKKYKNNYGNINNFNYPINHKSAKKLLNFFIKKKLYNFGSYQDFISKDKNILYHSLLSSSINIGLIQPIEIIKKIIEKKNIPLNSKEGYIRQLFWREYQRYTYKYINYEKINYLNLNKKIDSSWYNGNTNNEIINITIKKAFDTSYLHHIERLMIIGNYMVLNEIKPYDGFKWFMEFSIDSYLWVMHQNVYDMVFFVGGGLTMRRPYISSSNYILKMSDYKKGDWSNNWNKLYDQFVKKHKKKLWKFRYYIHFN